MLWKKAIKWLGLVAAALGLVFGVYGLGSSAGGAKVEAHYQAKELKRVEAQKAADDEAARVLAQRNNHIVTLTADYNLSVAEAKNETASIINSYKSDNLRLREHLRSSTCVPGADNTGGSAEASTSGLQAKDVEFLIQLAGRADQVADQLRLCQGVLDGR